MHGHVSYSLTGLSQYCRSCAYVTKLATCFQSGEPPRLHSVGGVRPLTALGHQLRAHAKCRVRCGRHARRCLRACSRTCQRTARSLAVLTADGARRTQRRDGAERAARGLALLSEVTEVGLSARAVWSRDALLLASDATQHAGGAICGRHCTVRCASRRAAPALPLSSSGRRSRLCTPAAHWVTRVSILWGSAATRVGGRACLLVVWDGPEVTDVQEALRQAQRDCAPKQAPWHERLGTFLLHCYHVSTV